MKTLFSALLAAALVGAMVAPADAASKGHDRNGNNGQREYKPCVVTGWTDWALTRPIFKCPDQDEPARNGRRK